MVDWFFPSDVYLKYSVPKMIVWSRDGRCFEVTYDEYDEVMRQATEKGV